MNHARLLEMVEQVWQVMVAKTKLILNLDGSRGTGSIPRKMHCNTSIDINHVKQDTI